MCNINIFKNNIGMCNIKKKKCEILKFLKNSTCIISKIKKQFKKN